MEISQALKRLKMLVGVSPSENIISAFKIISEAIKELQGLKDKQEQGLLLELPVKIGEVIYSVECGEIVSDSLYAVNKDNKGLWAINQYGGIIGRFGHTVFATRSEAEAALAKMERDSV